MNYFDPGRSKGKPHPRLRRGMYLLPSFFTAGSLGAGYFSITQTIASLDGTGQAHMHLDWAAIAILFAIPFDALDGRIARMTNTASDFGKELDSLADVITFGVAPSLLAFVWGFHFLPDSMNAQLRLHLLQAGAFICFFFFSAEHRVWRGSISAPTRSRAIPAGPTGSTLWGCRSRPRPGCWPRPSISSTHIPWRSGGLPYLGSSLSGLPGS